MGAAANLVCFRETSSCRSHQKRQAKSIKIRSFETLWRELGSSRSLGGQPDCQQVRIDGSEGGPIRRPPGSRHGPLDARRGPSGRRLQPWARENARPGDLLCQLTRAIARLGAGMSPQAHPSARPGGGTGRVARASARPGDVVCQLAQAIARLAKACRRSQKASAVRRRRSGSRSTHPPFFEAVLRLPNPVRRMPGPMSFWRNLSGEFRALSRLANDAPPSGDAGKTVPGAGAGRDGRSAVVAANIPE